MEKIQNHWKESFLELVQLCKINKDEKIIILTETISRDINFQLLETALKQANLAFTHIDIPTKPYKLEPIIKSTGASNILDGENQYISKLKKSDIIFDLSKEGLMHSKQTKDSGTLDS